MSVTFKCVTLVALISVSLQGILARTWSCPVGWQPFDKETPYTCSQIGNSHTSDLNSAYAECSKLNASLIMVESDEKFSFMKNTLMSAYPHEDFWLGLVRRSNSKVYWTTKDGDRLATSLPHQLQFTGWSSSSWENGMGLVISSSSSLSRAYQTYPHNHINARYICEKKPDCATGSYGLSCENSCHCHGKKCDTNDVNGTCDFGCKIGWMGKSCNRAKEDATISYYCVKSKDLGKYVHIRIHTKGVEYDNIRAVSDTGEFVPWCSSTEVTFDSVANVKTIKIPMRQNMIDDLVNGSCAGKVVGEEYSWRIKIQEKDGFTSSNDQEVDISCAQFTEYDSLSVSDRIVITGNTNQRESLTWQLEKVELSIVDPYTGADAASKPIGSPVALKVKYGMGTNTEAVGVIPYNCEVSTSDEKHHVRLIDSHGCPREGSFISAFHKNGSKTLVTEPFPLLGFPGSKELKFHCSYLLCYDNDYCPEGCDMPTIATNSTTSHGTNNGTALSRHKRSFGIMEHRIAGTVIAEIKEKSARFVRAERHRFQ